MLPQPGDIIIGGNAGIHDHSGFWAGRGAETFETMEHLRQSLRFSDITLINLTAPGETTGVKHQAQGNQGTIGTFLLGMSTGCKCIDLALSLKKGIGQIIQGNGRR